MSEVYVSLGVGVQGTLYTSHPVYISTLLQGPAIPDKGDLWLREPVEGQAGCVGAALSQWLVRDADKHSSS